MKMSIRLRKMLDQPSSSNVDGKGNNLADAVESALWNKNFLLAEKIKANQKAIDNASKRRKVGRK